MKPEAHKFLRSSDFLFISIRFMIHDSCLIHLNSVYMSLYVVIRRYISVWSIVFSCLFTPPGRWCQGNWLGRNPHRWRPSPKIPHGAGQRCLGFWMAGLSERCGSGDRLRLDLGTSWNPLYWFEMLRNTWRRSLKCIKDPQNWLG